MNLSANLLMDVRTRVALFIATGGYAGYSPIVPGTVGSLVGLLLYFPMSGTHAFVRLGITAALFALGVWASSRAEQVFKTKDPRPVVIDEIVGMWLSLISSASEPLHFLAAFLLFRFFDVVKPFPAGRAERLKGGFGVMADDVIAGLYANAALQAGRILMGVFIGA